MFRVCWCSIVLSVDDLPTGWGEGGRIVQRSLYYPQENSPKHSTGRSRRGSAPYVTAQPQETKSGTYILRHTLSCSNPDTLSGDPAGVVASMVEHFNLRSTRSVSQISGSLEISSPVSVWHIAGQKPGGPDLHKLLASNGASNLLQPQNSSSHVSSTGSEDSQPVPAKPYTQQEKRFSSSGKLLLFLGVWCLCIYVDRCFRPTIRHTLLRCDCQLHIQR